MRLRSGQRWRNWISGDWLEQLAYEWLMASGIDREAIDCNLEAGETEKRSETNREIDLLVHHRNQTSLIEIKAGLPQGSRAATLEQQVSSLGTRFGKTRNALLIGPQLLDSLHRKGASRAQSLWLRCLASEVTLLLDQEQLVKFVHGDRVWPKYKDEELYIPDEFSEGWLNGLDPAQWLRETLEKLPTCPNSQIDSLLPFLPLRPEPLPHTAS